MNYLEILNKIKNKRILVIGDIMLDEYWEAPIKKISQESPIGVYKFKDKNYNLGGAANVAMNLKKIDLKPFLISSVGNDKDAKIVNEILFNNKIDNKLFSQKNKKTIKKLRVYSDNINIFRIDFEENYEPISLKEIKKINKKFKFDSVILSDYDKGNLKDCLNLISYFNKLKINVYVDPKSQDFIKYRGAYLVKPNLNELEKATKKKLTNLNQIKKVGFSIVKKYNFKFLLVTLGNKGMILLTNKLQSFFQDSLSINNANVIGAGDTVISSFVASDTSVNETKSSLEFSSLCAGLSVLHFGTKAVNKTEIIKYLIENRLINNNKVINIENIDLIRGTYKKIVFTNGCFDILHKGHIHLLKKAKSFGDLLIVGLNSDNSIKSLKGNDRPINNLDERLSLLSEISYIDLLIIFEEKTPINLIKKIKPKILVKGDDYKINDIVGGKFVKKYGGNIKLVKLLKNYSSTNIINKIS